LDNMKNKLDTAQAEALRNKREIEKEWGMRMEQSSRTHAISTRRTLQQCEKLEIENTYLRNRSRELNRLIGAYQSAISTEQQSQ